MTEQKTPLDQALELFVFAPLGIALMARDQMPEIIEKGRTQVSTQITMARFIGKFAVQQGKVEAEKRLKVYVDPPAPVPTPAPVIPAAAVAAMPTPGASAAEPTKPVGKAPAVGTLAIPGYDSLSASQVVQRLAGLSSAELRSVQAYETTARARKTILSKIAQLQA